MASMLRVNGPPAGAGSSTTSSDCRPSWVVKMLPLSRNRASRMENEEHDGGLPDSAAQPVQQQVTDHDADGAAQPHLHHPAQPGLREKPRAIREEVAANSGPECPRTYSAKA